jgi:hypothetical protein
VPPGFLLKWCQAAESIKSETQMARYQYLFLALLTLPLAGCYADQQKQLATCEASATHTGKGEPLKSIQACMDQAGYRFIAWDNPGGPQITCDMIAVVRGTPSSDGTDALCFEPKGWLALKIFHFEVPVKTTPAT